jgi:hypothetical protein
MLRLSFPLFEKMYNQESLAPMLAVIGIKNRVAHESARNAYISNDSLI